MNTNKTVLVTGGAGFVGTHLCRALLKKNYRVISLDNYFTGSKKNHLPNVEYRIGHTKDILSLIPESVDWIFHLGEYSRVAPSVKEPDLVWDLNLQGTQGVLEYWRKYKGSKLIYAGSSTKFAHARNDGVIGKNMSPYSWSKAANTELIHNYGRWYNLPYSIAYFYNVYGPGERSGQFDGSYGTVIETFKQCFLNKKACTINGDGTQTRAFTHVFDTVEALLLMADKGVCDEYGISAQEVYSLLEVADMFGLEKEFSPATLSTRSSGACDVSNLEKLGWRQRYKLADYIKVIKEEAVK